jgi:hypothetical protein
MKSVISLIAFSLVASVLRGGAHGLAPGGYYQEPKGNATFTAYKNCQYAGKQR